MENTDFRIFQVFRRRLLRPLQQLLPVDDLQLAALVGAVAEIDTVAGRTQRYRSVQLGRNLAGGSRLLADEAEIADLDRIERIAEVEDLGHPSHAPTLHARDQVGDAGVALPPALVGVDEA